MWSCINTVLIGGGLVDGVMIASRHGADPLPNTLPRMGIPVVANGRPRSASPIPYVDVDHIGGVRDAVGYLLGQGRRRTLRQSGRRGPDDVAEVGFDDVEVAR